MKCMHYLKSNIMQKWCVLLIAVCICITSSSGKTRWSSLHIVPDADFFKSGEFTIGFDGFLAKDTSDKILFKPTVPIRFGINEWVNVDLAWAGGISLGIKARILGETHKAMPSLAIGVRNLFNHKEVNYFNVDSVDDMAGEMFLALSKGVDQIKTRFHLGILSIPANKKDKINPYIAIEKYFGLGLYTSFEMYRRQKDFNLCLFANWRIFKKHLEISLGAVDLASMFVDDDKKFAVSLAPSLPTKFVNPGVWIGLKFRGSFGLGSNKGFMSVEDRMRRQDETIETLVEEVDSLNSHLKGTLSTMEDMQAKMGLIIDSVINDPTRIENIIFAKLSSLKSFYSAEPFDPDRVKLLIREIASYRDKALPSLEKLLLDHTVDRYIRMYSAAIIGEIGNTASSDILLDVLAKTADPDIKIEVLIALGKMKETRAMYLLEQLANSPNDAIAMTAQEVLMRLSEETGAEVTPDLRMRRIRVDEEKVLAGKTKGVIPDSLYLPDTATAESVSPDITTKEVEDTTASEATFTEEDIQTTAADTAVVEKKTGDEKESLPEEVDTGSDEKSEDVPAVESVKQKEEKPEEGEVKEIKAEKEAKEEEEVKEEEGKDRGRKEKKKGRDKKEKEDKKDKKDRKDKEDKKDRKKKPKKSKEERRKEKEKEDKEW